MDSIGVSEAQYPGSIPGEATQREFVLPLMVFKPFWQGGAKTQSSTKVFAAEK